MQLNQQQKPPKNKIDRTSLVGWIILISMVVVNIGVYNGLFSLSDFSAFISSSFSILVSIGFILSKDNREK